MTCPTCGQPLPERDDSCALCGHSLASHDIKKKRLPCSRFGPKGTCECQGYVPREEQS